jgi:hypothetical protein
MADRPSARSDLIAGRDTVQTFMKCMRRSTKITNSSCGMGFRLSFSTAIGTSVTWPAPKSKTGDVSTKGPLSLTGSPILFRNGPLWYDITSPATLSRAGRRRRKRT